MEDVSAQLQVASDRPASPSSDAGRPGQRRGWEQPWRSGSFCARLPGCGVREEHRGAGGVRALLALGLFSRQRRQEGRPALAVACRVPKLGRPAVRAWPRARGGSGAGASPPSLGLRPWR